MGNSTDITQAQVKEILKEMYLAWCKNIKEPSGPLIGNTIPELMVDLFRRVYNIGQEHGLKIGQKMAQREHEIMLQFHPEIKDILYKS